MNARPALRAGLWFLAAAAEQTTTLIIAVLPAALLILTGRRFNKRD